MGEKTKIEWTHHTFNPWWGCLKVSPACEHCYAETFDKRIGGHHWGPASTTPRRFLSEDNWAKPLKWNRDAEQAGERRRVFCASMADVFEDNDALNEARERLWWLISDTPWLDWLLLTKRPENILKMVPEHYDWPRNVWVGTTVESQEYANQRIPALLKVPAVVRFLSMEPLLGPVDLNRWIVGPPCPSCDLTRRWDRLPGGGLNAVCDACGHIGAMDHLPDPHLPPIDWVITGGESGPHARPGHPGWYRSLRDQCQAAGVAFHFKQWGEWAPIYDRDKDDPDWRRCDVVERESPNGQWLNLAGGQGFHGDRVVRVKRLGTKAAGRELDGRTWDESPTVAQS